jgi:hypothetical protein
MKTSAFPPLPPVGPASKKKGAGNVEKEKNTRDKIDKMRNLLR